MKRILPVIFIIFCSFAVAEEIEVTHKLLGSNAEPGKTAIFEMSIRNDMGSDDTFIISKDEFGESPFSEVIESATVEPNQLDIMSHEKESAIVKFKLLDDAIPEKNYKTFVRVKSLQNPELNIKHEFVIKVVSPEDVIKIDTNFPNKVIPGKEVVFQVELENTANILLEDVDIYIVSDLFSKQYKERFYAYQEITKDLSFELDKMTKEGNYILGVKVYKDNKLKGNLEKEFVVVTNPDIEEEINVEYSLLSNRKTITKTNNGNVNVEESYSLRLGPLQRWLTRFDKEPSKIIGNNFEWIFDVKPGESYSLVIVSYNNSFYWGVLLVIAGIFLYMWFKKRKLLVKKNILKLQDDKKNLRFKVMLHLKNNTNLRINDIRVMDVLPSIIKSTGEYGTLKPSKIQKGEKSGRLVWEIESLEKGEERILSYNVVSGLKIFGRFGLPLCVVKYKKGKKLMTSKSNRVASLV